MIDNFKTGDVIGLYPDIAEVEAPHTAWFIASGSGRLLRNTSWLKGPTGPLLLR